METTKAKPVVEILKIMIYEQSIQQQVGQPRRKDKFLLSLNHEE